MSTPALRAPRRLLAALLTAALLAALAACSSSGGSTKYTFSGSQTPPTLIAVADRKPAEDFTGSLLQGKGSYDLTKDASGKITVVNFWGSWCGPCQIETPQFSAVYQQYKNKGVTFVGIDIKESSRGAPIHFVEQNKIAYPIVYDQEGQTSVTLGNIPATGAPYTVLLDRQHRVAGVYLIRLDEQSLTAMLNKLVAEK